MRVLIVGAGAIGCLVGGLLALAGHRSTLVGRPRFVEAVEQRGLILHRGSGTDTICRVHAVTSLAAAFAEDDAYDLGVLAVKSYDTAAVTAQLVPLAGDAPPFLTLQNGVGNEEMLAQVLGRPRVVAGAITTVVALRDVGEYEVSRPGEVVVAPLATAGPVVPGAQLVAVLNAAGFQARSVSDYRALKWTKLFMNQLCNASCAILGWTPAQVFADKRLAGLEIAAWRETLAVMHAQGLPLLRLGGYPFPFLAPFIPRLPASWLRLLLTRFVSRGRGSKLPSLYLDLAAGRGRSEVAYLNGAVARAGARLGIATPVNETFDRILQEVTGERQPWAAWRNRPDKLWLAAQQARAAATHA